MSTPPGPHRPVTPIKHTSTAPSGSQPPVPPLPRGVVKYHPRPQMRGCPLWPRPLKATPLSVSRGSAGPAAWGGGRSRGVAHTEGRQWPPPWQRPRPGAEAVRWEPEQEEEGGGAGLRPRSPAGRQGVYYSAARGAGPHLPSSRRVHGARGAGSPVLASHPRLAAAGRCGASAGPGLPSDSHCAARQCVRVTVSADRSRDVTRLSGLSLGQGHRGGPHRWRPASPDSSLPASPAGCRPRAP